MDLYLSYDGSSGKYRPYNPVRAMVYIWEDQTQTYVPSDVGNRCGASWASSANGRVARGSLCGESATETIGDVWFCEHHLSRQYRLMDREMARRRDRLFEVEQQMAADIRKARGGHEPVVYVVERDGFIKIGTTTNLKKRIQSLSGQSDKTVISGISRGPVTLLATTPGDTELERQLHVRFADCCVGGEWFLPNTEMRLLIARFQRRAAEVEAA